MIAQRIDAVGRWKSGGALPQNLFALLVRRAARLALHKRSERDLDFSVRPRDRRARLEPRQQTQPVVVGGPKLRLAQHRGIQGQHEVWLLADSRARKGRRRHTHDRDDSILDGDCRPNDGGIAAESAGPVTVAEHRHGERRCGHVSGGEQPADGRIDAKGRVIVRRHEVRDHELLLAVDPDGQVDPRLGERTRRGLDGVAEILEQRIGDRAGPPVEYAGDLHQPTRFLDRQRPQHHAIDQAEYGHVRADTERERENRDCREGRTAPERAQCVAHISHGVVEPAPASVANGLFNVRDVAQLQKRLTLRFLTGQPCGHVVVD